MNDRTDELLEDLEKFLDKWNISKDAHVRVRILELMEGNMSKKK